MVKGNGDRRRELAKNRRKDQKLESARRREGPLKATPSEVRARLLDLCAKNVIQESNIKCWIVAGNDSNKLQEESSSSDMIPNSSSSSSWCMSFLKMGSCSTKRCRFKHEIFLDSIYCEQCSDASGGGDSIEPLRPIPGLRDLKTDDQLVYDRKIRTKVRKESTLRFVQYNNTALTGEKVKDEKTGWKLVYDYSNPHVFACFIESLSLDSNDDDGVQECQEPAIGKDANLESTTIDEFHENVTKL